MSCIGLQELSLPRAILALLLLACASFAAGQDLEDVIPLEQQLAAAIDSGSVVAVRRVLAAGADPNAPHEGTTPLVRAVRRGKSYVVDLLCREGAQVSTSDSEGWTPLLWAIDRGEERVVRVLLKQGADANATEPRHGLSALQAACGRGESSLAGLLLAHGARWEHTDRWGGNCLEEAAFAGHAEVVELLCEQGMEVQWPLHVAAGLGQRQRVEQLLAQGVDANLPTRGWKNTPLSYAVGGGQLEIVRLLAEHGAQVGAKNAVGATPLHVAAGQGHAEIAAWLLEREQSLRTAIDNEGYTPLDWSRTDAIRQLLGPTGTATDQIEKSAPGTKRAGSPG